MQQPLRVVGAAIVRDGTVLACRRNRDRSAGGLWEFPGGKIEPDESPQDALVREIREELGVTITVGELLDRRTTDVEGRDIDLTVYRAQLVAAPPTASSDHDCLEWCPLTELADREWSPADAPLVEVVVRNARAGRPSVDRYVPAPTTRRSDPSAHS